MGGRGIPCALCDKTVNRHNEVIQCEKCDNNYHIECVNITTDEFKRLVESKSLKKWNCDTCNVITINADDTQNMSKQGNVIEPIVHVINVTYSNEEKRYIPIESIIRENQHLVEKNSLLETLIQEMRDKNKLLAEKLLDKEKIIEDLKLADTSSKSKVNKINARVVKQNTMQINQRDNSGSSKERNHQTVVDVGDQPSPSVTNPPSTGGELYSEVAAIETEVSDKNDGFTEVVYKKRRNKPETVIGTAATEASNGFEAAERLTWLYLGRVKPTVTIEMVKNYIKAKCNTGEDPICEKINSVGRNLSFKIGMNAVFQEQLYRPDFWPKDTLIRRYTFFRARAGNTHSQQWSV